MDIQRIRYFLEVARQKNFSRAAEFCFVSQPSLSQQIKKLEEEIGGELFVRSRARVRLSPLGEAFLEHAQAIMAQVATAREFVAETKHQLERTLRFGAIPTVAPYLIPPLFARIRQARPDVRLELLEQQTGPLLEALRLGEIDFALLSPPLNHELELDSIRLAEDEFLLTLPATHPLAGQPTLEASAIRGDAMILLEGNHCLSQQTAAYCEQIGLSANLQIRSSQIDTLLCLVEAGFGLTFTPRTAAEANAHRQLVFRPLGPQPCHRELRLYWLPRHVQPRLHHEVLELLQSFL